MKTIGYSAFDGCTSLTEITLPSLITEVGSRTFYQCTNLKDVYSKNLTPPTSYDAFREIAPDTILYVPKGSESDYEESPYWKGFFSLILTDDLITHSGSKGLTFTLDEPSKTATVSGYISQLLPAEVGIPSTIEYDNSVKYTVTGIADNVFANNSALKEVTIPASVTHIGDQAFFNCANLQKVHTNNPAPPINGFGVFISINQYAMLYVPVGSKDDYMATDWGRYFFAVIEEQVSSVGNVEVSRNPVDNAIYTVSGQRVNATDTNTLPAGMYIVNGRKVIIKR